MAILFRGSSWGTNSKSNIHSCKSFSEIPKDRCFYKVIIALQYEVKANRVAKKVIKWFNEGHRLNFAYRFTGKDSRLFCHNFMQLIKAMSCTSDSSAQKQHVLVLSYIGLRLRDCCSIFNRLNINESDIDKLLLLTEHFHANYLILQYTSYSDNLDHRSCITSTHQIYV